MKFTLRSTPDDLHDIAVLIDTKAKRPLKIDRQKLANLYTDCSMLMTALTSRGHEVVSQGDAQ